MPRYALKRDANHRTICDGLRLAGAKVEELFDVDAAVGFKGRGYLLEIKAEDQKLKRSPGLRKNALREKQKVLQEIFGERYLVVTDLGSALQAIGYYD